MGLVDISNYEYFLDTYLFPDLDFVAPEIQMYDPRWISRLPRPVINIWNMSQPFPRRVKGRNAIEYPVIVCRS